MQKTRVKIENRASTKYYKREWTAIFIGERMPSGIACNRATRTYARTHENWGRVVRAHLARNATPKGARIRICL